MSGYNNMQYWYLQWEPHRRHIEQQLASSVAKQLVKQFLQQERRN